MIQASGWVRLKFLGKIGSKMQCELVIDIFSSSAEGKSVFVIFSDFQVYEYHAKRVEGTKIAANMEYSLSTENYSNIS